MTIVKEYIKSNRLPINYEISTRIQERITTCYYYCSQFYKKRYLSYSRAHAINGA